MKDPNLFNVWIGWLHDLGGDCPVIRDTSDPKPKTGRRDPDKKPRQYFLPDDKYGVDPETGTIWRRL